MLSTLLFKRLATRTTTARVGVVAPRRLLSTVARRTAALTSTRLMTLTATTKPLRAMAFSTETVIDSSLAPEAPAAETATPAAAEKKPRKSRAKKPATVMVEVVAFKGARAPSAYALYTKDTMPALRTAQPNLKLADYARQLGSAWKALSDDAKKPFVERAAVLKEETAVANAKAQAEHAANPQIVETKKGKGKSKKSAAAGGAAAPKAKRAPSAYMLFVKEQQPLVRTEKPGQSAPEYLRLIGAKWKALSADDKKQWTEKAAAAAAAAPAETADGGAAAAAPAAPKKPKAPKKAKAAATEKALPSAPVSADAWATQLTEGYKAEQEARNPPPPPASDNK